MTRTLGSVRGAAGNGGPYRDRRRARFRTPRSGGPVRTVVDRLADGVGRIEIRVASTPPCVPSSAPSGEGIGDGEMLVATRPRDRWASSHAEARIRVVGVLFSKSIAEALSSAGLPTVHVLDEVGVQQCDRHRAFAHSGGDALD